MDIFKFNNPSDPALMEQGEIINNLKSKMWIERYEKAGEFELIANAHTGMKEKLPIGSFISHVDTPEIMIVENHEISDDRGKEIEITITGRSFETFFDQRLVGNNKPFPEPTHLLDFEMDGDFSWNQAIILLEEHLFVSELYDDNNQLPYISIIAQIPDGLIADVAPRDSKRGSLYSAFLELLKVDDFGVKIVRPGPWSPLAPGSPNVAIVLHKGVDRTSEVIFSYDTGEIESADYLWSNKKVKNAVMVCGRWLSHVVTTGPVGIERRWMMVEATDIDSQYDAMPSGGNLTIVSNKLLQRGIEVLAAQKEISLTKAEVSKEVNKTGYRTDFDVGDTIMVSGDYNTTSRMRITEYVETEDETGKHGYPTLTMLDLGD